MTEEHAMEKMTVELTVLIPVFNELEEAIDKTVNDIVQTLNNTSLTYEIILVDDGSNEQCASVLSSFGNQKNISVISNPYNLGYSASLKKGIIHAQGQYILTIDADGSYPADAVPEMLSYINKYNMVVGSRTGQNVAVQSLRKPVKEIIRVLAEFLTNTKIPDPNSGLRIFTKELALKFFHLLPSRFSFSLTLTLACLTNDYTIKYVPTDYLQRIGKSSIRPLQDTVQFFFQLFRIIMYFRPLRFFMIPAVILLMTGFTYLGWGIIVKQDILDGAIMLLVVGFQVLFTGFLADIITRQKLKE